MVRILQFIGAFMVATGGLHFIQHHDGTGMHLLGSALMFLGCGSMWFQVSEFRKK